MKNLSALLVSFFLIQSCLFEGEITKGGTILITPTQVTAGPCDSLAAVIDLVGFQNRTVYYQSINPFSSFIESDKDNIELIDCHMKNFETFAGEKTTYEVADAAPGFAANQDKGYIWFRSHVDSLPPMLIRMDGKYF